MNVAGLIEILEKEGYTKQVELLKNQEIDYEGKSSIKLEAIAANENGFELGESKIGGCPHLKNNFDWPIFNGKPLAFLGQINLKKASEYDIENLLPSSGILYFFYEGGKEVWGFDPEDKDGFKVIYEKDMENLNLTPLPEELDKQMIFSPCKLKFKEEKTYSNNQYYINNLLESYIIGDDESVDDEFQDIVLDYFDDAAGEIHTQLLGNPHVLGGDIFLISQLASNGLNCGDGTVYDDPKAKELESGLEDWSLLFQLDCEEDANMVWGFLGVLCFTIKKEDLKNQNFDDVWFILQSC